jgi:hypothetical protein
MVLAKELSQLPLRQGASNVCLLSSYGAALFPFTHTLEIQYFVDCCDLLGLKFLTPGDCIALLPSQKVDSRLGTSKNGSGYDWLEELHNNCPAKSFNIARSVIQLKRGLEHEDVELLLKTDRTSATVAISFKKIDNSSHSICVIYDPNHGYVARDSGRPITQPKVLIDACGDNLQNLLDNLYGRSNEPKVGECMVLSIKK